MDEETPCKSEHLLFVSPLCSAWVMLLLNAHAERAKRLCSTSLPLRRRLLSMGIF